MHNRIIHNRSCCMIDGYIFSVPSMQLVLYNDDIY